MPYTTATAIQKDPKGLDGRIHFVVEFTGTGETAERRDFYVDGNTTNLSVRQWAIDVLAQLNNRKTIADAVTVPYVINTAAIVPAAPTAKEVWIEKAQRLARLRALGTFANGTLTTEIGNLAADVAATYQTGWIADL